jgi:Protein of unknown function (DUF998)
MRAMGSIDLNTRRFLWLGLVPLPLFLIGIGIAGLFAPTYSWISGHGSELSLAHGPAHTIFTIVILAWGISFVGFAIGLLRMSSWRSVGAYCWLLFGLAMCSNAIWPMGSPLHGLYSLALVSLIAPALSLAETESLRRIRGLTFVTILVSLAGVFYLWLNLLGLDPPAYRGLTQRLFSSLNSFWPAFVAWRVWRG